jgi:hypothetical protein
MAEPMVKNCKVGYCRKFRQRDACLYSVKIKSISELKGEAKGLYLSTDLTTSSPFEGFVSRL